MASIEKRTNQDGKTSYRVKIRLKGYLTQTATFDRLTDAKKWAQHTEAAIREGRHFKTAEAKRHTFTEMVNRYIKDVLPTKPKQQTKQTQQLEWWKAQLGHYTLADVTPALIVQYRDELANGETYRGTKRSPATVVRYMAALSHAFTIAVNEWQWLEDSPMRKVKKPKESRGRVRFLNDDERCRLLQICKESSNEVLYTCVVLALSSGMRQGEQMSLTWADVNLKDGFIILHETKNGERRRVPLVGHALELLREHSKVRRLDTDLLFPGKNPAKPVDLRRPFENVLKEAGIYNFVWHDMRHCFASSLCMSGASIAVISEALGHKSLAMTKRYSHLTDGHISGVVADMNNKLFGGYDG